MRKTNQYKYPIFRKTIDERYLSNFSIFSVPMNRIKVGMTSSPNLKKVQSKVGSLANANHRPGGGEIKIRSQKLEWKAEPRTKALNAEYKPQGGDKRVT